MEYNWSNLLKDSDGIDELFNLFIKRSERNLTKIINYDCVNSKEKFVELILTDTFQYNKFLNLVSLLNFITNPKIKIKVSEIDNKLLDYNYEYKTNKNLKEKIGYFMRFTKKIDSDFQFIIDKINNSLNQKNALSQINDKKLNECIEVINKLLNNGIKNDIVFANINIFNYDNIIKKCNSAIMLQKVNNTIRKELDKYNLVLNYILLKKIEFLNKNDSNYFDKREIMKKYLIELNSTIKNNYINITNEIINNQNLKIINNYDYTKSFRVSTDSITISKFFEKIIMFYNYYFDINIKQVNKKQHKNINLWGRNIIILEVGSSYIYLDLLNNNYSNKPTIPIMIELNEPSDKIINTQGNFVILANYQSLEDILHEVDDMKNLFIAISKTFIKAQIKNNFGFSQLPPQYNNLFEKVILELFNCEQFLGLLFNDDFISEYARYNATNKLINTKHKIIDSLFEMNLLYSDEILQLIKNNFNAFNINELYDEFYRIYNTNAKYQPFLSLKLIKNIIQINKFNDNYFDLISDIMATNIRKNIISKQSGSKFINIFNYNLNQPFEEKIKNFFNGEDFDNNFKKIIKILNNESSEIKKHNVTDTEATNYFCEN